MLTIVMQELYRKQFSVYERSNFPSYTDSCKRYKLKLIDVRYLEQRPGFYNNSATMK
jgi:hypothetical protein